MPSNRINWVDFGKAMSIILVVFHHAVFRNPEAPLYNETILMINGIFAQMRMPLFFFLSGIFIYKAITSKFRYFFKFRFLHLLYLYVLWSIIRYGVTTDWEVMFTRGNEDNIFSLATIVIEPPNTLWFIYALLVFLTITWLTSAVPIITFAFAMIFFVLSVNGSSYDFIDKVAQFYPFYLLGYFTSDFIKQKATNINWYYSILPLGFFVFMANYQQIAWTSEPLQEFLYGLSGITIGVVLAVLMTKVPWLSWMEYVGKNTLPIYVMHFLPVMYGMKFFDAFFPQWSWLAIIGNVTLGVAFPLLVMVLAKKMGLHWLFEVPFINKEKNNKRNTDVQLTNTYDQTRK